jgi:hypothetical protein
MSALAVPLMFLAHREHANSDPIRPRETAPSVAPSS